MKNKNSILLDVRTTEEIEMWSIEGSLKGELQYLSPESLKEIGLSEDQHNAPIIIHCRSGGRSMQACIMMEKWGFTDLTNLEGGIKEWYKAGLPILGVSEL